MLLRRVGDETVAYDLVTHRAHCLNRVAALVLERCDGRTPVAALARETAPLLGGVSGAEATDLVRLALRRLREAGLLEGGTPPAGDAPGRRAVVQRLAAASLLPVITSIIVPTPAEAQTCIPRDGSCASSQQCCPNAPCCRRTGPPGSPPRCRPGGGECLP